MITVLTALVLTSAAVPDGAAAQRRGQPAQTTKPNILVIWGDDIGWFNTSVYNQGMMGYRTPNIDRIANEGMRFTDAYGENSCTAGRAAFITGQSPFRTGLLKVGLPGAELGLQPEDPTIADLLKTLGYATGQFGKNHLGDRDEHLPTAHGFDEFFGNLYHLNAEEEPENPDYPKDTTFRRRFGPRGVLRCRVVNGRQSCQDTGPLTRKRMETVDEEFLTAALDFIDRQHKAGTPFFTWFNSTRMHIWTHLRPESEGRTGLGIEADGMVEHDGMVGRLLKKLDDLGITQNTIVIYSTDNGAEVMSWPDGGSTPFRGEKNTTFEGGFRVPMMVRWPGHIRPGQVSNQIISQQDWLPTLLAAAGMADAKEKLLAGLQVGNRTFKVHIDGYNFLSYLTGRDSAGPRREFFYFTDDGGVSALRYNRWKLLFTEQRGHGFDVWQEPFVTLRLPKVFDLFADPFERAEHEGMDYARWRLDRVFLLVPAQAFVGQFLQSFKDFPPRQRAASFNLEQVMESLQQPASR